MHQTCTSDAILVFGCSTVNLISLYFTIINRLAINTYKPHTRTVDPKVEGSSPFGLVEALSVSIADKAFLFVPSMTSSNRSCSGQFAQINIGFVFSNRLAFGI